MEASTVYYTDFRCPVGTSLTDKLRRVCIAAGIKNIDMEGKFVAIIPAMLSRICAGSRVE